MPRGRPGRARGPHRRSTSTRPRPSRCTPRLATMLRAALDQGYADPRRLHGAGRSARLLLDNARDVVAECLGVRRDEVTFTSSGTDAVHRGLLGLARARARRGRGDRALGRRALRGPPRGDLGRAARRRRGRRRRAGPRRGPRRARRRSGRRGRGAAEREPRGRHGPAGRRPRGCPTTCRSSSTPARPWAGSRCRTAGRPPPARPTSGAARPAWACCSCAPAPAGSTPSPATTASTSASPASRTSPRPWRPPPPCRRSWPSGDEVNARQFALVDRIRDRGRGDPRRRGGRRPGGPAPPPGHVLLPLRRRRGAGERARPPRLRRRQRLGVHRLHPRAQPRAGRDGRADPRQRAGVPDPGHDRRGRRAVPGRAARRGARRSGPRSASVDADLELDCRGHAVPAAGDRARPPRRRRPRRRHDRRARRRRGRRGWTSRRGAGCAAQEYVGEDAADDGTPRYVVRRLS